MTYRASRDNSTISPQRKTTATNDAGYVSSILHGTAAHMDSVTGNSAYSIQTNHSSSRNTTSQHTYGGAVLSSGGSSVYPSHPMKLALGSGGSVTSSTESELVRELRAQVHQLTPYKDQCFQLRSNLVLAEERVRFMEDENKRLNTTNQTLRTQFTAEIESCRSRCATLEERNNALQCELTQAKDERDRCNKSMSWLRTELEAYQTRGETEGRTTRETLTSLRNALTSKDVACQELQTRMVECNAMIQRQEVTIEAQKADLASLREELNLVRGELTSEQKHRGDLELERDTLLRDREDAQHQVRLLRKEVDHIPMLLDQVEQEKQIHVREVTHMQAELSEATVRLQHTHRTQTEEVASLRTNLEELRVQYEILQERLSMSQRQLETTQTDLKRARSSSEEMHCEVAEFVEEMLKMIRSIGHPSVGVMPRSMAGLSTSTSKRPVSHAHHHPTSTTSGASRLPSPSKTGLVSPPPQMSGSTQSCNFSYRSLLSTLRSSITELLAEVPQLRETLHTLQRSDERHTDEASTLSIQLERERAALKNTEIKFHAVNDEIRETRFMWSSFSQELIAHFVEINVTLQSIALDSINPAKVVGSSSGAGKTTDGLGAKDAFSITIPSLPLDLNGKTEKSLIDVMRQLNARVKRLGEKVDQLQRSARLNELSATERYDEAQRASREDLAKAYNEARRHEDAATQAKSDVARLRSTVCDQEERIRILVDEKRHVDSNLSRVETELRAVMGQLKDYEALLAAERNAMRNSVVALDEAHVTHQREVKYLREAWDREVQQLRQERDQLTHELHQLEEQRRNTERELVSLSEASQHLERETQAYQQRMDREYQQRLRCGNEVLQGILRMFLRLETSYGSLHTSYRLLSRMYAHQEASMKRLRAVSSSPETDDSSALAGIDRENWRHRCARWRISTFRVLTIAVLAARRLRNIHVDTASFHPLHSDAIIQPRAGSDAYELTRVDHDVVQSLHIYLYALGHVAEDEVQPSDMHRQLRSTLQYHGQSSRTGYYATSSWGLRSFLHSIQKSHKNDHGVLSDDALRRYASDVLSGAAATNLLREISHGALRWYRCHPMSSICDTPGELLSFILQWRRRCSKAQEQQRLYESDAYVTRDRYEALSEELHATKRELYEVRAARISDFEAFSRAQQNTLERAHRSEVLHQQLCGGSNSVVDTVGRISPYRTGLPISTRYSPLRPTSVHRSTGMSHHQHKNPTSHTLTLTYDKDAYLRTEKGSLMPTGRPINTNILGEESTAIGRHQNTTAVGNTLAAVAAAWQNDRSNTSYVGEETQVHNASMSSAPGPATRLFNDTMNSSCDGADTGRVEGTSSSALTHTLAHEHAVTTQRQTQYVQDRANHSHTFAHVDKHFRNKLDVSPVPYRSNQAGMLKTHRETESTHKESHKNTSISKVSSGNAPLRNCGGAADETDALSTNEILRYIHQLDNRVTQALLSDNH